MELAEDRRAFRHPFRRAGALDQRPRLQGRQHRYHSGEKFRGAGLRHRLLGGVGEESRLPAHRRGREGVGEKVRRHPGRLLGADAHRLVQAQRQRRKIPQCRRQGSAFAGPGGRDDSLSGRQGRHRLGLGMYRHRRRFRRRHGSAVSRAHVHAQEQPLRPRQPVSARQAAAERRDPDRGAAQDRQRHRQPACACWRSCRGSKPGPRQWRPPTM